LKDDSEVVVAEKNRKVVGFIGFKKESDYVCIDNIDITKNEQRKGIDRAKKAGALAIMALFQSLLFVRRSVVYLEFSL